MNILVAGDFCPQNRVAEIFEKGVFAAVMGEVKPVIEQADYSIVNFECPVTTGGEKSIEKCGPNLQCSEKGMEAVKWAGFDCVTLANNHFLDYGKEGVEHTLEACRKYSVDTVGGGMNLLDASRILYKEIKGETLAIINCCEHEFSIATETTAGSNPLNPIQQFYAIKEARKNADYVMVIVHGGHELWQLPSPRMVETYRFFIDAGADAVINHHQQCFNGFERYHEKLIFYGLGNFCFDNAEKQKGIWTEGYAVTLDFSKERVRFEIHPYIQCAQQARVQLLPKGAYDVRIKTINDVIKDEKVLKECQEDYYRRSSELYENVFEPIRNRLYLGAKRRGWLPSFISRKKQILMENFIVCEAHRDKLIWWLTSKNE